MNPISKGLGILSAVLFLMLMGSGVVIYKYRADVAEGKTKVEELKRKLQTTKVNKKTCENALKRQNRKIAENKIDYEKRLASVREVTAADVEARLRVKYKDRNVSKEMCNETASVIDAIRRTGF